MMQAAMTSERMANFYQTTRRYNPEHGHLRTHSRENLKFNFDFRNICVKTNLDNVIVAQVVKKFPAPNRNEAFITVFKGAHQ
jgi:hypothetical protein